MNVVGFIPARLQSSRLPRKMLLNETGKPLIQHTWESASRAKVLQPTDGGEPNLIVATDSFEIVAAVHAFGGKVEMTGDHPSGTDRIAEVVRRCCSNADIIVNIQGDEPDIDPTAIDKVVEILAKNPSAQMSTLCTPITEAHVRDEASCVKVVQAADGRALYFSRSTIPFVRDGNRDDLLTGDTPWRLHLGIYAYRREFLLNLTQQPPSRLEQLEKLEQLRALELGATIQVAEVAHRTVGIDTPDDYARFVRRRRAA
jgi:3-deoxy-manno-octulosonate cytidylyltransferase (CMP-KDO synthetase)